MCMPTKLKLKPTQSKSSSVFVLRSFPDYFDGSLFPLHPAIAVLGMTAFVPSWWYLNRGFTVWFHLASLFQGLTQSKFLANVLAVCGISICVGWYAAIVFEYLYYGRFCYALYRNMPTILMNKMLLPKGDGPLDVRNSIVNFESTESLVSMAICHVLDFLAHPGLTYYFWKKSFSQTKKDAKPKASNNRNIVDKINNTSGNKGFEFSLPVIFSAFAFSRSWSMFHTYFNHGAISLYYVSDEIYVMDNVEIFYVSYVAETLFLMFMVVRKLQNKDNVGDQVIDGTNKYNNRSNL